MEKHVINTCRSLYTEIKEISNVHHSLAGDATETLLCAFVLSKLDYCNSLLSGSPKHLLDELQKIYNYADLSSKLASINTINPSFRNFTGYK